MHLFHFSTNRREPPKNKINFQNALKLLYLSLNLAEECVACLCSNFCYHPLKSEYILFCIHTMALCKWLTDIHAVFLLNIFKKSARSFSCITPQPIAMCYFPVMLQWWAEFYPESRSLNLHWRGYKLAYSIQTDITELSVYDK